MTNSLLIHLVVALYFLSLSFVAAQCPDSNQAEYDYIVVGSGAGGGPLAARLAEAGFSVLVVDAGNDVPTINTTIPLYFIRAIEDEALELAYTVTEYPPGFEYQKSSWYPRSRALGGSTVHNALINIIADTRSDFDGLATMFNDSTWSRDNMQDYFKRVERHVYPVLNNDHGTDGWLTTNLNPVLVALEPQFFDLQIASFILSIAGSSIPALLERLPQSLLTDSSFLNDLPLLIDLNSIAGDDAIGLTMPSFTTTADYRRSSVQDRLASVQNTAVGRLTFSLDTLATKVLTCSDFENGTVQAYGVEIAKGAALPVAGNFNGKEDLHPVAVTARREIILSAGAFQTPQLLMLSGIGDRDQLQSFGIETVVDLPGVGTNLQDHDEIGVIWTMKQNYSLFNGCSFLADPDEDPCLEYNLEGNLNLYSFGGTLFSDTSKSREEYTEPDMLTYWQPAYFPGFVQGFAQDFVDHHNSVSAIHLKAHPSSRGTVRLTGPHPQDLLDIRKNRFQNANGTQDVEDLREAIKRSRQIMKTLPVALFVDEEIFPGEQAQTDEEIDAHIYENIFGHHVCCTCPMGVDDDEYAVLDGDFRVRGVQNLRVVDASSWPVVPGYFVTTPIYMISEKAAQVIIGAVQSV